ncbi:MAG: hypothetical protein PHY77_03635 [Desulfotomaculaceae bacterium]|nr:hypothetical protein [Desulfotomaculaceae bacterium]
MARQSGMEFEEINEIINGKCADNRKGGQSLFEGEDSIEEYLNLGAEI